MERNPEPGKESAGVIHKINDLPAAIRKRPGMYFGTAGSDGIPRLLFDLLHSFLSKAPADYAGPIHVSVREENDRQSFELVFDSLRLPFLPTPDPAIWTALSREVGLWDMDILPAATADCLLEIADGHQTRSVEWKGGYPGLLKTTI